MTDQHEAMVERLRAKLPGFGPDYDRLRARHAIIVPLILARRERGWTQRDLARESGVQQPVIARLETGDTEPTITTVTKLAAVLGLQLQMVPSDAA